MALSAFASSEMLPRSSLPDLMISLGRFQKENQMTTRGQRLLIFATKRDWTTVLSLFEGALSVKYVESGMFPQADPTQYASFHDLPNFGEAMKGDAMQERTYLVIRKDAPIN